MKARASRKPTSLLTLVNRTYRKVLELEREMTNQIALNRLRIESLAGTVKDHGAATDKRLDIVLEAVHDTTQMMHLYQTHFDDLAKNFGAGAISAINAMEPEQRCIEHCWRELARQSALRSTDTRKPESVPPVPTEWAATTSSEAYAKYRQSVQVTGYPCSFSHLHQPGIKCAVCQLTPPPSI